MSQDLDKNFVIDEEAFERASERLLELSQDITALRNKVNQLLEDLKAGFDTPAGKKFFRSCGNTLIAPMDDQSRIIQHVAENLRIARAEYQSVFEEYRALNNAINNANE